MLIPVDGDTSVISVLTEEASLLPMAITRVDAEYGCVSGLTSDGRWMRPGPIALAEVEGSPPRYAFRRPFRCSIAPSTSPDSRIEDRLLLAHIDGAATELQMTEDQLLSWYLAHVDADVNTALGGERSVGLIEVTPERVYLLRSTQQRFLVRMCFKDASGTACDWVVPDIQFSRLAVSLLRDAPDQAKAEALLMTILQPRRMFLTIVLTKPTTRARGVIRGCQPLVGGVHTFPDYARHMAELAGASS